MGIYRKKPVRIEARQFDGSERSMADIVAWSRGYSTKILPVWGGQGADALHFLRIETLEGTMEAIPGDFIIKGVQDEFYPCKPDIFNETYERIPS